MIPASLEGVNLLLLAEQDPKLTGNAWMGMLGPEAVAGAAEKLLGAGYHLEDVSGLDALEGLVAAYTFAHMDGPGRVSLRVLVPHDKPEVPTIGGIFQGALWHERETHDFYGIRFTGHPDLTPLLLPADMKLRPLSKEEGKRASVRVLFGGERMGRVVFKAGGYNLFDEPEPEPAAETEQSGQAPAPQPEQGGADA